MSTITDLRRFEGETEDQLILRICSAKEEIGTWQNVADILNDILGYDYDESKYRKDFATFCRVYAANEQKFIDDEERLQEMRTARQELQKEKQKLSDERSQYNKLLREQARRESFADMVKNIICENVKPIDLKINRAPTITADNDLLVHITDIHTGIEINNWKNTFNQDVLKLRLERYVEKIIEIQERHKSQDCYIVIGEIVSGIIHNNLRLQNNMDLMEQFKYISELLAVCLINLSPYFDKINVFVTPGNHSRIVARKEDSLDGENMDVLLPFYLKAKLQNIPNIIIKDNKIEPEIAMFSVRGQSVMAAHGHKDVPSSVVQNMTMMFGIKPDIVLLGHRHLNGFETVYDTKVISSGCLSGTDDYAMSIRKSNKPEQTVSVIDHTGLVCLYDIKLD